MMNFAIMGYGTVGSGVAEVFFKNHESLERRAGHPMELKYILDVRDFADSPFADRFIKDFDIIANDDEVRVVAEVIGGVEPAYTFTKTCLEHGKSVVTSNKELVAQKGAELLEIARAHHCNYFFEASVGGGIPIIRPLHMCLAANRVEEIAGILNGTTNFILTKMISENMQFETALKMAQDLGYAERNPAADIEGADACRKICILASLSFGEHVFPKDVYTEGITKITLEDVAYAENWGGVIKLIGRAKRGAEGEAISAMVSPAFIRHDSQLGTVSDVFNAILVRGDATGDVVFYGKGAGKLPTASAVMADIIDCTKASDTSPSLRWKPSQGGNVADVADSVAEIYYRCRSSEVKLPETATRLFGDIQTLTRSGQPSDEFAFIAPARTEREHTAAEQELEKMGVSILGKIRVLDY